MCNPIEFLNYWRLLPRVVRQRGSSVVWSHRMAGARATTVPFQSRLANSAFGSTSIQANAYML
jgi:hypothetical protein